LAKTRFFALLKHVREKPETFSIDYQRKNKGQLGSEIKERIKAVLLREKNLLMIKKYLIVASTMQL
jgi:hypothetical protein